MASMTHLDELKRFLYANIEHMISRLNGRTAEDKDGRDYLVVQLDRILYLLIGSSAIFNIPIDITASLQRARQLLVANEEEIQGRLFQRTGCRGRPAIIIPKEQLELYLEYNFTPVKIAKLFSVSTKTIRRRIDEFQLKRSSYSCMSNAELDQVITEIVKEFPNCGYRQMRGHLRAREFNIQWNRIQDSMRRVCPEGILMRALRLTAVNRRTYSVQAPLSLWHIDGNHKLIRLIIFNISPA